MTEERTPLWLDDELERDLMLRAAATGQPLPTLVEDVLRGYVRDAAPEPAAPSERRSFRRHTVEVPAVVHTTAQDGRTGRYRVAQLRDISATGVGLRFEVHERESLREGREFEVLFQLQDHPRPLRLACRASRKVLDGAGYFVGAVFTESIPGFDERLNAYA